MGTIHLIETTELPPLAAIVPSVATKISQLDVGKGILMPAVSNTRTCNFSHEINRFLESINSKVRVTQTTVLGATTIWRKL